MLTLNKVSGNLEISGFNDGKIPQNLFVIVNNFDRFLIEGDVMSETYTSSIRGITMRISEFAGCIGNMFLINDSGHSLTFYNGYSTVQSSFDATVKYSSNTWYDLRDTAPLSPFETFIDGEITNIGYIRFRNVFCTASLGIYSSDESLFLDCVARASTNRIKLNKEICSKNNITLYFTPITYIDYVGNSDPGF